MATEFDEAEILNDITGSTDPILIPGKGAQAMPKRNAVVIAARKETALATVLRAQQREGYRADHLVGPICRHVLLAKNNSTASQLRLAVDVVGHANVVAEDEAGLAFTIRQGISRRRNFETDMRALEAAGAGGPGPAGPLPATADESLEAHLRLLMHAPPRLAASIVWADRELVERYVKGGEAAGPAPPANDDSDATSPAAAVAGRFFVPDAARAAAIAAIGRCLSRATALDALVGVAPYGSDATGAYSDGARFAQSLWRRVVGACSGADDQPPPSPRVQISALNAVALLIGPALDGCHPVLPRLFALHAPDPSRFGYYSGGGATDEARWRGAASDGDGGIARGAATSATGDDPTGAACPLLAALRFEACVHVLTRADAVTARANALSLEWRGVAAAVATAPACAALRAAPPPKPRTIDDPVGGDGEDGALAEDDNASKVNVLMRLRDAGCAALPVAGAQAALVEDLEKLRAIAMKAANAAGESLMRRALVEVSQCGGYSTGGTCALACGFGMLSLSGSLPKHAQPLDWASAGCAALFAAFDRPQTPQVNDAAVAMEDIRPTPRGPIGAGFNFDVPSGASAAAETAAKAGKAARGLFGRKKAAAAAPTAPARSAAEQRADALAEATYSMSKQSASDALRLPKWRPSDGADAVAPVSKAAVAFAIATALPTMPIHQPLPAIRALVNRVRLGLCDRPDLRVAVLAIALLTHARMRTHPEAIIVMSPLGEILAVYMDEDQTPKRAAAAATAAVQNAQRQIASWTNEDGKAIGGKIARAETADVEASLPGLKAAAAEANAAMKQTQFREELVVAAVEGILSIKPRNDVELSGWLQVALEASATLRTVPLWQGLCGRRAAADATFRLLARLCATTRACVNARPGATDAEGTHKAAQRVLTALTQEAAAAAEKGTLDDAAAAAAAWIASRHLDFASPSVSGVGSVGTPGGPTARVVTGLVAGLLRGGVGRASWDKKNASEQRSAGTLSGKGGKGGGKQARDEASAAAAAMAGLACVDLLAQRCPAMIPGLAKLMTDVGNSTEGGVENIGHAASARAKTTRARLALAAAATETGADAAAAGENGGRTPPSRPPPFSPPTPPDVFPPCAPPPPLLLSHLADGGGRTHGASSESDWSLTSAAWRALHADVVDGFASRPPVVRVPLSGTSDPLYVEASHVASPGARRLTVIFRCRPPPTSNAPNAAGASAAALAGLLKIGLEGACALVDGALSAAARLGTPSAAVERATLQPPREGRVPGHAIRTVGVGCDEESVVAVDVAVIRFGRVAIRPLVIYDGPEGRATLRCAAYAVPLTELLAPAPTSLADFDRLWSLLPATISHEVEVPTAGARVAAAVRLVPIRPRSRGARRSLRTFPVVTLHPRFPFNV
jgi:hypothetical protein